MMVKVLAIPQGWKIGRYVFKCDRIIWERKLQHFGGPMLRYNVENSQLQERGRSVALTKPNDMGSGRHKIDGVVCLVMAIAASVEEIPIDVTSWIGNA